jgi:hypothetical protein
MLYKTLLIKLGILLIFIWIQRTVTYGQKLFYLMEDSVFTLVLDTNKRLQIRELSGPIETFPIVYTFGDFSANSYAAKLCFVNRTGVPVTYDKHPTIWNDCAFRCYPDAFLAPGDSVWVKLSLYPGYKFHSTYAKNKKLFKRIGAFSFYTTEPKMHSIPVCFLIHLLPLNE